MPGVVAGVFTWGSFPSFLAPISTPSASSLWSPLSCKVLVTLLLFLPFHFISQADYILKVGISALIRVYNSQGKLDGYFLNFLIPILLIEGFPSEEPFALVFAHCLSSSGHNGSFKVQRRQNSSRESHRLVGQKCLAQEAPRTSTGTSLARGKTSSAWS